MSHHRSRGGKQLVLFVLLDVWCLFAILFASAWFPFGSHGRESTDPTIEETNNSTCSVFMAPSSLHGVESMGIYTVKDLPKRSVITNKPDGLSIPVVDYNVEPENATNKTLRARNHSNTLFNEYWWGRGIAEQLNWEADGVLDFKLSFGQLPNHHCLLDSIGVQHPKNPYNDGFVNRRRDPGVGAFSYHTGREFIVERSVKAGEELFLNYGYCKDGEEENSRGWTQNVIRTSEFTKAASLARAIWVQVSSKINVDPNAEEGEAAQRKKTDKLVMDTHESLSAANPRVGSVFPKSYDQLKDIMTSTPLSSSVSKRLDFEAGAPIPSAPPTSTIAERLAFELGTTKRTVSWIQENGLCVDNIAPGPSTLPHAGQGAISQRKLTAGDVIVPAPMLHIMDRDVLRVSTRSQEINESYQLLLNYCFGHKESSLLLCPITNAMLINHCSARRKHCGGRQPNARYQWATSWDNKTKKWLGMTLDGIEQEAGRGLSMEIVATRDIHPGEEIFMDYGEEWEDAWESHVNNWKPPSSDMYFNSYVSPTALNAKGGPLDLLVTGDLRTISTHSNLFTGCIFWETDVDTDNKLWFQDEPDWEELDDETLLQRYSTDDGDIYNGDYDDQWEGSYWPCSVIRADNDDGTSYTVRIFGSEHNGFPEWEDNDLPRYVTNFPRESIRYFNRPYTSDQHIPNAFRHHVEIRDDIFPEQWKDRKPE